MVNAAMEIARGPRPRAGLLLVITAGEETGCKGAVHLAAQPGVLDRAGAIVVGEPTANYPLLGHKGAIVLKAVTHGVTAHMPRCRSWGSTRSMPRPGPWHDWKISSFRDDPHPVLGAPTLNVGTIEGGMNLNSVPDRAVIGIDVRTISGQSVQATVDDLAAALGADVSLEDVSSLDGIYTEPGNRVGSRGVRGDGADPGANVPNRVLPAYFTDAAILGPAFDGPPTVILGPGDPQMAHQTDEYCAIDQIDAMTQAYLQIATRWCGV